jgi:hypothetical protein
MDSMFRRGRCQRSISAVFVRKRLSQLLRSRCIFAGAGLTTLPMSRSILVWGHAEAQSKCSTKVFEANSSRDLCYLIMAISQTCGREIQARSPKKARQTDSDRFRKSVSQSRLTQTEVAS